MTPDESADEDWNDLIGLPGDEVDRLSVQEVERRRRNGDDVLVLDVDCGRGELAIRLAQAGARVTALVAAEAGSASADRARTAADLSIRFLAARIVDLAAPPDDAPYDLIIVRRSLPFLRYQDALALLGRLNGWLKIGGKIIVSAFGIHSHLGDAYPDADKPVQQRYATLPDPLASRYGLPGPVCLYSERDLFLLVFESGIGILRSLSTTHGNVKAIGVRV